MKSARWDAWIEYGLVALPALGLLVAAFRPEFWPALIPITCVATLPFVLATLRGLLDRRLAPETFPVLAICLLLLSRDWRAAAGVVFVLGALRLTEQRLEHRSLAALETPIEPATGTLREGEPAIVDTGGRIPADGIVIQGAAFVDQTLVTGTNEPIERLAGDPVFAGTVLRAGSIKMRIRRIGDDALVARIRDLIRNASHWPSPAERIARHASAFSYWFLALAAAATWVFTYDTGRLAALLLVVRPDALAAAASLTSSLAAATAGRLGALIRGGAALERLATVRIAVFEKSGPLTFAETRIGRFEHDPNVSDAYVWECVAVAEAGSRHPVGRALYREAIRHIGRIREAETRTEHPGRGVVATLGGHEIVVGTAELHRACGVTFDGDWLAGATTPVEGRVTDAFLALDGRCVARLRIEEHPRADVRSALEGLRALGVNRALLFTPDSVRIAAKQAETIGLSEYRPSMSTEETGRELGRLRQAGDVLFIGDGARNPDVLRRATASLAVAPDDPVIETTHLSLVTDDFSRLPDLVILARAFHHIIRLQVGTWIVAGAGGILFTSAGLISPTAAAAYAFMTSITLYVCALRIMPRRTSHRQERQNKRTYAYGETSGR